MSCVCSFHASWMSKCEGIKATMPGIVTRASLESHASKIGAGPDGICYVWALLIGILQMLLELFANGVFFQKQLERSAWIQRII